jgi:hypothetical protein
VLLGDPPIDWASTQVAADHLKISDGSARAQAAGECYAPAR